MHPLLEQGFEQFKGKLRQCKPTIVIGKDVSVLPYEGYWWQLHLLVKRENSESEWEMVSHTLYILGPESSPPEAIAEVQLIYEGY